MFESEFQKRSLCFEEDGMNVTLPFPIISALKLKADRKCDCLGIESWQRVWLSTSANKEEQSDGVAE